MVDTSKVQCECGFKWGLILFLPSLNPQCLAFLVLLVGNMPKRPPSILNETGSDTPAKKGRKTIEGVETFYSKSKAPDMQYLSMFAEKRLVISGKAFHTPEHAYHAAKCWRGTEDKSQGKARARDFMVGGCVDKAPLAAKRAGSKAKLGLSLRPEWHDRGELGEPLKLIAMRRILEARYEQDTKFRAVLKAVHARGARLLHFERSGPRSYWGGFVCQATGKQVGGNRLGELMMGLCERTQEVHANSAAA